MERHCSGERARGEFAAGQDPGHCRRNADRLAVGLSPPREALDREMLELIKDVRDSIKAPSSPLKNGQAATALGSDEIAALIHRQGNPLAGLEFKQTLPVIEDSDLDFDRHLREFRSPRGGAN